MEAIYTNTLGVKRYDANAMHRANKGEVKSLVDVILMNVQLLLTNAIDSATLS